MIWRLCCWSIARTNLEILFILERRLNISLNTWWNLKLLIWPLRRNSKSLSRIMIYLRRRTYLKTILFRTWIFISFWIYLIFIWRRSCLICFYIGICFITSIFFCFHILAIYFRAFFFLVFFKSVFHFIIIDKLWINIKY